VTGYPLYRSRYDNSQYHPVTVLLQTLKNNIRERKYENRQAFLNDVVLIYENSKIYNGPKSVYTHTAQQMLELTFRRFAEVRINLVSCTSTASL